MLPPFPSPSLATYLENVDDVKEVPGGTVSDEVGHQLGDPGDSHDQEQLGTQLTPGGWKEVHSSQTGSSSDRARLLRTSCVIQSAKSR